MPNKIVYVDKKIGAGRMDGNYIGWNAQVNKRKKLVKNMPKNTFYIYNDGDKGRMDRTILHEEVEEHLMRTKGMGYKKAHKISNLIEDNPDLLVRVRGDSQKRGTLRRRI